MIAINKGLGSNEQNWNYGILLKLPIKEFQENFLNNKKNDYLIIIKLILLMKLQLYIKKILNLNQI